MKIVPNQSFEDNTKRGFTLVEVLTVILLLSLLVVIAVPAYKAVLERGKKKNYEAKVSLIEMAAEKYAIEENLMNSTTITLNELITEGYVAADKVDSDGNYKMLNEVSGDDMNCYTVTIQFNNDLPNATLNDTEKCSLIDQETGSELVKINAYKMTAGGYTAISYDAKDKAYDWSNEDILLIVSLDAADSTDPIQVKYADSFKDLSGTDIGIKWIGKDVTENGPNVAKDYNEVTNENIDTYKNALIITAASFQKQEYQVELKQDNLLISGRTVIRIDKEAPTAKAAIVTNWENGGEGCIAGDPDTCTKLITVKTADQNGSGPKTTCISTKDNGEDKVCQSHYSENKFIGNKVTFNKPAGTYYVYTEDNAGNISDKPVDSVYVTNIDTTDPAIEFESISFNEETDDGFNVVPLITATCSDLVAGKKSGPDSLVLETQYYDDSSKIWVTDDKVKDEADINSVNGQLVGTTYIQGSKIQKQRIKATCSDIAGNIKEKNSAEFELKTVKITFNGNGAKVVDNSSNEVDYLDKSCITYNNEKCIVNEPTIARNGYNIFGWNLDMNANTSSYTNQVNTDATYYAITSQIVTDPEVITITINYDRGTYDPDMKILPPEYAMSSQVINSGTSFTLDKNKFIRNGHHFHGWSAHRDGKVFCNNWQWQTECGTNNEDFMHFKDQYTFNSINVLALDGTITFYATWEDHKYEDKMWWSYNSVTRVNQLQDAFLTKYIGGEPSCDNKHGFTGWIYHYKYERVYYKKCTVCGHVDYTQFWCPCDDGDKLTGCYLF